MYGDFLEGDKAYTELVINGTHITPKNISSNTATQISRTLSSEDTFCIGGFASAKLTVSIATGVVPSNLAGQPIKVYSGFYSGDGDDESATPNLIPMGVFYAVQDDIKKKGIYTNITAYDKSYYLTNEYTQPSGSHTVAEIISDIASKAGITVADDAYDDVIMATDFVVKDDLSELTYREALGHCAFLIGANAMMDRDGELTFKVPGQASVKSYDADSFRYDDFELRNNDSFTMGRLEASYTYEVVTGSDVQEYTQTFVYQAGSSQKGLKVTSVDLRSQTEVDALGEAIFGNEGFTYQGFSLKTGGRPEIDVGDTITVTDEEGAVRNFCVMSHELSYTGASQSTFSASAPDSDMTEVDVANSEVSVKKKVKKLQKKIASNTSRIAALEAGGGGGGGINVVSVDTLPANPASDTLYLVRI